MKYVEEREFNVHLILRYEFPEDYEGERDGYAWADEIPRITTEMVSAVVSVLSHKPGWKLRTGNRGRPPEDEITLILEKEIKE